MFGQSSAEVRNKNMLCVRTIYDLWENLSPIANAIDEGKDNIQILVPLKHSYILECHVHRSNHCDDVERVIHELKSPENFRQQHVIRRDICKYELFQFLNKFGTFFSIVGLENPWPLRGKSTACTSKMEFSTSSLDQLLFERVMARTHMASTTSAFKSISQKPRGKHYAERAILREHVDAYIRNKNVLVRNLSENDEFESMQKLRDFFLDFGDLLNFSFHAWNKVYFIVYKATMRPSYISNNVVTLGQENKETSQAEVVMKSLEPYSCIERHDRIILQVRDSTMQQPQKKLYSTHLTSLYNIYFIDST